MHVASVTPIPATLVAAELGRITLSQAFHSSPRHRHLLRHLVERTAAGDTAALKESVLALEVFARPPASFDPERDTIVRVEVRRLRQRLQRYYGGEGADAAIEIELPVGTYVPTWRRRAAPADTPRTQAADLVQHGHRCLQRGGEEGLLTALARFTDATHLAPADADAHVGIALAWLSLAEAQLRPDALARAQAKAALRIALRPQEDHSLTDVH